MLGELSAFGCRARKTIVPTHLQLTLPAERNQEKKNSRHTFPATFIQKC